jgi:hypothetical protein
MSWRQHHNMDAAIKDGASAGPRIVAFSDQRDGAYLVRDLDENQLLRVPKGYAQLELFPPTQGQPRRGALLLRLSKYALIGAVLGGVGGLLLGTLVALAAMIQLGRFNRRVRRWRHHGRSEQGDLAHLLPAIATGERSRVLGALGQGALAAVVGAGVCLLLLPHVLHYLPR